MIYSTAEYCTPVWCHSAHTRLINSVLNDALRIVTGCLRLTPTHHQPILLGIQPSELRRLGATLSLAKRGTLDPDHILHVELSGLPNVPRERLKSRRPFVPAARKLLNGLSKLSIRAAQWTNYKCSAKYLNAHLYSMFSFPGKVLGPLEWACPEHFGLSSIACGLALGVFIRPCTNGVSFPRRSASVVPPTADHAISTCPIHQAPREVAVLTDHDTRCWLSTTTASI